MRKLLIAVLFVAAMMVAPRPAPAGWAPGYANAPWCAVISLGNGSTYWDCQYASIEQCRPNVLAGNRGFCNPNPYFVAQPQPVRRHAKHWRHQY
jgi:hypothetical protein